MVFISKNDNCDAKMIVHASGESQLNHSVSRNNCNLIFLTISCSPSYYTYLILDPLVKFGKESDFHHHLPFVHHSEQK